jgi:hypothetical protein
VPSSNFTVVSLPAGAACRVLPAAPPSKKRRLWLHFVGDSNTRNSLWIIGKALGITHSQHWDTPSYRQILWSDTVVLTHMWWYAHLEDPNDDETDYVQLASRIRPSHQEMLEVTGWTDDLGIPPKFADLAPSWTYISFGSHAPKFTALGTSQMLDRLEPLILDALTRTRIVVALTTAIDVSKMPPRYFDVHMPTMRNNVMLNATNSIISDRVSKWGIPYIDLYTVTRTMGLDVLTDVVHFKREVYKVWADLLYTHLQLDQW